MEPRLWHSLVDHKEYGRHRKYHILITNEKKRVNTLPQIFLRRDPGEEKKKRSHECLCLLINPIWSAVKATQVSHRQRGNWSHIWGRNSEAAASALLSAGPIIQPWTAAICKGHRSQPIPRWPTHTVCTLSTLTGTLKPWVAKGAGDAVECSILVWWIKIHVNSRSTCQPPIPFSTSAIRSSEHCYKTKAT